MKGLRALRMRRGLSQRELARRAGVAFRTVQTAEGGGHGARLSTLAKIAGALGRPGQGVSRLVEGYFSDGGGSIEGISTVMAGKGAAAWKLHLFDFVDAFRRRPGESLVAMPPSPRLSRRLQALLASTVELLCAEQGVPIPLWCAGIRPLPAPWFVAGMESLKAAALAEAPAQYRKRNIFVLGNFLDRA